MDSSFLGEQLPTAIIVTYLIEWLKTKPWFPFAKIDGVKINRACAVVMAIITGIGLHIAFDPAIGNGTLTITGLNWSSIVHSAWAAIQQYALQHVIYWTAIVPHQNPPGPAAGVETKPVPTQEEG